MTTQEPIKLRGHHIAEIFSACYINVGRTHSLYDLISNYLGGFFKRKKKTEDNLHEKSKYDKLSVEKMVCYLMANPEQKVEIVKGLDSWCLGLEGVCSKCLFRNDDCIDDEGEDDLCLREYGLKVGEFYTAKELTSIARTYFEKTGYDSPRTNPNNINVNAVVRALAKQPIRGGKSSR